MVGVEALNEEPASGTDIKPVEIVFFMRNVRSRTFFEQMKGRGVRTISPTNFNAVTPDAPNKERFVIIDAVGVTETELADSYQLDREPTVSFDRLLDLVAMGSRDLDIISSLASRLARIDRHLTHDRQAVQAASQRHVPDGNRLRPAACHRPRCRCRRRQRHDRS